VNEAGGYSQHSLQNITGINPASSRVLLDIPSFLFLRQLETVRLLNSPSKTSRIAPETSISGLGDREYTRLQNKATQRKNENDFDFHKTLLTMLIIFD